MTGDDLDLSTGLRGLPTQALTPEASDRVYRQASAVFTGQALARAAPFAGPATATAVVSAVAIYLTWAVDFLNALAR
jgi:hypothetical protein